MKILQLSVLSLFLILTGFETDQLPALQDVFEDAFLMGVAIDRQHIFAHEPSATETVKRANRRGYSYQCQIIVDPPALDLVTYHYNSITTENVLKWEEVHPEPGVYDFAASDRFVEIGEANDMFMNGHTLIWHNQTPDWVFEDEHGNELDRDALLERMRDHIHMVVGRYKGRIHAWDVVNEAVNLDGSLRESRWYDIIGEEYLVKAFRFAHEADPDAQLYYNDFLLEIPAKRQGVIRLIEYLQENNAPIHGVGSQSHFNLLEFHDLEEVDQSIVELGELGIDVMITELDINVLPRPGSNTELTDELNPYTDGLPDAVAEELANRYRELFEIYLKNRDIITRVTFWNVTDRDSWLNYLPIEGRTNYPLLFDRDYQPKRAFYTVVDRAKEILKERL